MDRLAALGGICAAMMLAGTARADAPLPRVYMQLGEVSQHITPPDPIAAEAVAIIRDEMARRARIVTSLGPRVLQGAELRRELSRRTLRGYRVQVVVREITFGEKPRIQPGPLQVESRCAISILLIRLPDGWLAFNTDVDTTVQQNVLRGGVAAYEVPLKRDALRAAVARAIDQALEAIGRPVNAGGAR